MSDQRPTVLTCAQPTGQLTLGNYLGAIKNWVALLDDYTCYFGIVDQHAITVKGIPAELRRNTLECIAQYIACGLDPEKAHLFVQSHIVGHTELAWVLGCMTPIGDLQRMTQFKEKASKLGFEIGSGDDLRIKNEGARPGATLNSGLLYYPVLMAADILLYNAHLVPTGEDQRQHLELTRDLAQRFNATYSETFNVPEPHMGKVGARIMSLQEPTKKMSKSDENLNATLFLLDEPAVLKKKIMSAVTDSGTEVVAREDKPGISNLLSMYTASTGESLDQAENQFTGKQYGEFKAAVADAVIAALEPVQAKYKALVSDKGYLQSVIKTGNEAAQKTAYKTLAKVYRKVGFMERPR